MRTTLAGLAALLAVVVTGPAFAGSPYTPSAGQNAPAAAYEQFDSADRSAPATLKKVDAPVQRDSFGNARGNQYDLAVDGAFEGQTVLILDQVGNTLENTKAALRQKGLSTVVYPSGKTPSVAELKTALSKSTQLWLISSSSPMLSDDHIAVIKAFFDAGHGLYLWGDNDLYADANRIADACIKNLRLEGDLWGDTVVALQAPQGVTGLRPNHLITTGLEHLYEGITIATVQFSPGQGSAEDLRGAQGTKPNGSKLRAPAIPAGFTPILYGSAGNLVSAAYEHDGKRLVVDGGFTRLAVSWDDAGTARYVKNAASWLVNAERFGDAVVAKAK